MPIGVKTSHKSFVARCSNPITGNRDYLGSHDTQFKAFLAYKEHKEGLIKQIAEAELNKGNITKECYKAMINYKVEITD